MNMTKKHLLSLTMIPMLGLSCGKKNEIVSQSKVTNGIQNQKDEFRAVAKVGGGGCTGTFVSPTVMVTAAHCSSDNEVITQNGVPSIRNLSLPTVLGKKWDFNMDIRVLVFPREISPVWMPVSLRTAEVGDAIQLAGFGEYDTSGPNPLNDGNFRYGHNVISQIEPEGKMVSFLGDARGKVEGSEGERSSIGAGDSGGPLIRDGALIGVASAKVQGQGSLEVRSLYLAVGHPQVVKFFEDLAESGVDIRFASECLLVDSKQEMNWFTFKQPYKRISKITGFWKIGTSWAEVGPLGHVVGNGSEMHPYHAEAPIGSLLIWSQHKAGESFSYNGPWTGSLTFDSPKTGVGLQIHDIKENLSDNSGRLKVCFE